MHTDPDFKSAVRREADRRLLMTGYERIAGGGEQSRSVRGHFEIVGKADADEGVAALRLLLPSAYRRQVHALAGDVERLAIVAAVIGVARDAHERHGGSRYEVVAPDVARFAPDRTRHRVDRQLHRKTDAGARDTPIRHDRRLAG